MDRDGRGDEAGRDGVWVAFAVLTIELSFLRLAGNNHAVDSLRCEMKTIAEIITDRSYPSQFISSLFLRKSNVNECRAHD